MTYLHSSLELAGDAVKLWQLAKPSSTDIPQTLPVLPILISN